MSGLSVLENLYTACTGAPPASVELLPSSGSNRRYARLRGTADLIGVIGTSRQENDTFIYLDRHFASKGLNVPEVVAVSDDSMAYLQCDLGDTLLFDAIAAGRASGDFSPEEKEMLKRTIQCLPEIQVRGAEGLDFSRCHPSSAFDRRCVFWDLNYFKYCFLKACGVEIDENALEDDFEALADILLEDATDTFMYRDFQSRNVMIRDGQPWFIDFQGGRKGPVYYDVASFLWQAKANFPQELREQLAADYLSSLRRHMGVDEKDFFRRLRYFVLFRTLQVLGAYGFRGYFEKKAHFLQSIPYAMANLRQLLREQFTEFPYLEKILRELADKPRFAPSQPHHDLVVKVWSFSYKKGLPDDTTGNGGGFVFDCRAVHNPGRYDRYKGLTGLDTEVIDFLEDNGEVSVFLDHCYALVDASVERYLKRGFTDLMVAFGCTGGRHRSVYCAEHMAMHIHNKYNVKIDLTHREQGISRILEPTKP